MKASQRRPIQRPTTCHDAASKLFTCEVPPGPRSKPKDSSSANRGRFPFGLSDCSLSKDALVAAHPGHQLPPPCAVSLAGNWSLNQSANCWSPDWASLGHLGVQGTLSAAVWPSTVAFSTSSFVHKAMLHCLHSPTPVEPSLGTLPMACSQKGTAMHQQHKNYYGLKPERRL